MLEQDDNLENLKIEETPDEDGDSPTLSGSVLGKAFQGTNLPSALNLLVKPGKDTRQLFMRTIIPDMAWLLGFTSALSQAIENKDEGFIKELLDILAGMVSLEGIGRRQLVEAVIGTLDQREARKHAGFLETFKKAVQGEEKKVT